MKMATIWPIGLQLNSNKRRRLKAKLVRGKRTFPADGPAKASAQDRGITPGSLLKMPIEQHRRKAKGAMANSRGRR
jgi:hypothetical protein